MALASALLKRYFVATTPLPCSGDNDDNDDDDDDDGIGSILSDDPGEGMRLIAWDSIRFERWDDRKHGKPAVAGDLLDAFWEGDVAWKREGMEDGKGSGGKGKEGTVTVQGKAKAKAKAKWEGKSSQARPRIDFNVSHQAGLVVLIGTTVRGVDVGVDVTCVDERGDMEAIVKGGFDLWVDVYEQVLSPGEVVGLKEWVGDGAWERIGVTPEAVLRDKLRRFYTLWACKEAYLKMTGEALLASWVQRLEFDGFRAPRPLPPPYDEGDGPWGERVTGTVPKVAGEVDRDTAIEIQAFEKNYIVVTAVRSKGGKIDQNVEFSFLNIDDIIGLAMRQRNGHRASNVVYL